MSGHLCAEMMQDDSSLYPLLVICTDAYSTLGNRCCHKSPTSYTVCNIRLAEHCPQHLLVLIQSMDTFLVGHLEVQLYGHFFFDLRLNGNVVLYTIRRFDYDSLIIISMVRMFSTASNRLRCGIIPYLDFIPLFPFVS